METASIERQRANRLYWEFRGIPMELLLRATPQSIATKLARSGIDLGGKEPLKFGTALRLLGRIAHQIGEEDFYAAVAKNEFPPIKLSAEEMELIRGGLVATGLVLGVAVGLGAVAKLKGCF